MPNDTPDREQRIAEIRERDKEATPPPWMCEVDHRPHMETAHYSIKTVEPQPAHPWSPRFIAWLCGGREINPNRFKELGEHEKRKLVDAGVRDDQRVGPDAEFIAHAREDIPWLLTEIERLTAEVQEAAVAGYETGKRDADEKWREVVANLKQELIEAEREAYREARDYAEERSWQERQGEDYGSY